MGRSQETFNKKEVRNKKEKKRKEKEISETEEKMAGRGRELSMKELSKSY